MKKLLFSAIVMIAFSVTSFANTKEVDNSTDVKTESEFKIASQDNVISETNFDVDGSCTVIVRQYNQDGEVIASRIHTFPAESAEDCNKIGQQVLMLYQVGTLTM
jgi:hypothetical protein